MVKKAFLCWRLRAHILHHLLVFQYIRAKCSIQGNGMPLMEMLDITHSYCRD